MHSVVNKKVPFAFILLALNIIFIVCYIFSEQTDNAASQTPCARVDITSQLSMTQEIAKIKDVKRILQTPNSTPEKSQHANSTRVELPGDNSEFSGISCKTPQADPWDPDLVDLVEYPRQLDCKKVQPDLTHVDSDGILRLNVDGLEALRVKFNATVACKYTYFDRGKTDRELIFEKDQPLTNTSTVLRKNFVRVICAHTDQKSNKTISDYENVHAHPVNLTSDSDTSGNARDLYNVFVLAFDSTSVSMMKRHLVKTYRYLTRRMKAVVFEQFQKVGENTLPNLGALFTGKRIRTEQKNMVTEIPYNSSGYYDHWPFVWREFSRLGYATAYVEEESYIGTFHYAAKGFVSTPLDYWYFPYWEAVRKTNFPNKPSQFCFGNKPLHDAFIDAVERHVHRFEGPDRRAHFLFSIFSSLSHDYTSDLGRVDDAFANFLERSFEKGLFNNTLLMVFGDHGPRFTAQRPTVEGFLEERQPFLAVWTPPGMVDSLPVLRTNSQRLTTMFDLHATLKDILYGAERNASGATRGYSVLSEVIPSNRTCLEAGVPDRYCLCHGVKSYLEEHPRLAARAADAVLQAVRNMSAQSRDKCVLYEMNSIKYFVEFHIPEAAEKGLQSYYVAFTTLPLHAVFEGAVYYNRTSGEMQADNDMLERLTRFQYADCVSSYYAKKFCSCSKYVKIG